jgi:hypothetical protein
MEDKMKKVSEGFKTFNQEFKHQFIECSEQNETISIKTKSGKRIAISVMEKYGKCIDIKYFDSPQKPVQNGQSKVEKFKVLGFDLGTTPIPRTDVTLFTILMNE